MVRTREGEHGGSPPTGDDLGRFCPSRLRLVSPWLSLRGAESSKRRSNPLNRPAQEDLGQGHPRNPEGIAASHH